QRVEAGLALDGVAAVTRVPHEGVVAGAEGRRIAPGAAIDAVVARAAGDRVVAAAAVEREGERAVTERGSVDHVVAEAAVDRETVARIRMVDTHLLGQSGDRGAAVAGRRDVDRVVAGSAVDRHVVRLAVALPAARRPGEVDRDLRDPGAGELADRAP